MGVLRVQTSCKTIFLGPCNCLSYNLEYRNAFCLVGHIAVALDVTLDASVFQLFPIIHLFAPCACQLSSLSQQILY